MTPRVPLARRLGALSVAAVLLSAGIAGLAVFLAAEEIANRTGSLLLAALLAAGAFSGLLYAAGHLFFIRPIRRVLKRQGVGDSFGWRDEVSQLLKRHRFLERRLKEAQENQEVFLEVSQALIHGDKVEVVHERVMEMVHQRVWGAPCLLWVLQEDGFLRARHVRRYPAELANGLRLDPHKGVVGQCFMGRLFQEEQGPPGDFPGAFEEGGHAVFEAAAALHFPLVVGEAGVGVLSVLLESPASIDHDRREALASLLQYLSMAIQNARFFEETKNVNRRMRTEVLSTTRELTQTNLRLIRRVRELRALYDVAALTATSLSIEATLPKTLERITDLLDAGRAGFFLWEEGKKAFSARERTYAKPGKEPHLLAPEAIEGWRSHLNAGEVVILDSPEKARELFSDNPPIGACLLSPMLGGGALLGFLVVSDKRSGSFEEEDMRALSLLSRHLSEYVWTFQLKREREQRLKELSALQEVASVLSDEPDLQKTLQKMVRIVAKTLGANVCAFLLYDEKTHELVTQPGAFGLPPKDEPLLYRIRVDDPLTSSGNTFLSGETILCVDAENDPRVNPRTARLWDFRSLIVAPLMVENRSIGVLRIGHREPGFFKPDDMRLAALIAEEAAIIVQNARLYQRVQEDVKELSRLNDIKTEFVSMVTHELITPLTSVRGFTQVLLRKEPGPLNVQQENFLNIANSAVDRLMILLDDLQDMTRIEAGKLKITPVAMNVAELLQNVVRDQAPNAQKRKLLLRLVKSPPVPDVVADPNRVRQVVENLVTNAMKFTPEGGAISLSTRPEGSSVLVSVQDTGIGIDAEECGRIFERFYQVNQPNPRPARGAGLGLAICKSLVEMHGGRIWVESKPGAGSNFQFILPRQAKTISDSLKPSS